MLRLRSLGLWLDLAAWILCRAARVARDNTRRGERKWKGDCLLGLVLSTAGGGDKLDSTLGMLRLKSVFTMASELPR